MGRHIISHTVPLVEKERLIAIDDAYQEAASKLGNLIEEAPRKRHKWGPERFGGSFVRHDCVSVCKDCGLERHRQFDYGQRRTIFRDPKTDRWHLNKHDGWSAPTPSCN